MKQRTARDAAVMHGKVFLNLQERRRPVKCVLRSIEKRRTVGSFLVRAAECVVGEMSCRGCGGPTVAMNRTDSWNVTRVR